MNERDQVAAETVARVTRLATERPDIVPVLRRLIDCGGEGYFDDVAEADLDELVRRGLLTREYLPPV